MSETICIICHGRATSLRCCECYMKRQKSRDPRREQKIIETVNQIMKWGKYAS